MRAIWSGTISFGLVSVAVRMYSATESKELRFHFLHKDDLQPIGYDKVRKDTGKSVDPDDVVRGFEIEKGKYVPIEDEDLDRLDIELTHSIDICDFVDLDEIDPIYYRKAYYLLPQDGAEKPYRLLARALDETAKVGIAKVVIRNKQHLAALRPYDGVLVLETMYYADEIRKPEKVNGTARVQKAEVDMAKSLVENLSADFKPEKYDDTYRKELLALIRKRQRRPRSSTCWPRSASRSRRPRSSERRLGSARGRPARQAKRRGKGEARRVQAQARPEEDA
jgi:DNA end-binding protein Ku